MKDSFKFDLQFVMDEVYLWTFYLAVSQTELVLLWLLSKWERLFLVNASNSELLVF